jgi:putative mRNA 3-end processing factor
MRISVYGSGREVGRSAIMLSHNKKNILLDCGIKVYEEEVEFELGGGAPQIPRDIQIDGAIISHAHLDHSGYFPAIHMRNRCPIYCTPPTQGIANVLTRDAKKVDPTLPYEISDIDEALRAFILIPYGLEHTLSGGSEAMKFTLHDAGHIPGAAITEVNVGKKKIVYTGDFKMENTRLHAPAETMENVDTLIMESTYALRDHPDRKETEDRMCKEMQKVFDDEGNVLFPAFAVGRTQELAMVLYTHDVELPIFVDGMGALISEVLLGYPKYVKNYDMLREAIGNLNHVGRDKNIPLKHPSAIISTAGMLEGGPAITYITLMQKKKQDKNINSAIFMTGYCLGNTNGWYLQNKQMIYLKKRKQKKSKPFNVDLRTDLFHLSAHAGRKDLLEFIKKANPQRILCVHGDHCKEFAGQLKDMGYDATAPENGTSIEV